MQFWLCLSLFASSLVLAQENITLTGTPEFPACGQNVTFTCMTTDPNNQGFEVNLGRVSWDVSLNQRIDADLEATLEFQPDNRTALFTVRARSELKGVQLQCFPCTNFNERGCQGDGLASKTLQAARAPQAPTSQRIPLIDYLGSLLALSYQNIVNGNHSNNSVFAGLSYFSPEADQYRYALNNNDGVMINVTTDYTQVAIPVEPDEQWTGTIGSLNETSSERQSCFSDINPFGRYLITRNIQCEDQECTVESTVPLVTVNIMSENPEQHDLTDSDDKKNHFKAVFTVTPENNKPALYNVTFTDIFDDEYFATVNVSSHDTGQDPVNATNATLPLNRCLEATNSERWSMTECWGWEQYTILAVAGAVVLGVTATIGGVLIYQFKKRYHVGSKMLSGSIIQLDDLDKPISRPISRPISYMEPVNQPADPTYASVLPRSERLPATGESSYSEPFDSLNIRQQPAQLASEVDHLDGRSIQL